MFFRMVYKSGQIFLPFCHNTRVWQTDGRTDRQNSHLKLARTQSRNFINEPKMDIVRPPKGGSTTQCPKFEQ